MNINFIILCNILVARLTSGKTESDVPAKTKGNAEEFSHIYFCSVPLHMFELFGDSNVNSAMFLHQHNYSQS